MKCEIIQVGVPLGSPGKVRFRLPWSIGEVRMPACAAGKFAIGSTMTVPFMSFGFRPRISFELAICPSYSSPWLPDIDSTVGPLPFLMMAIGIARKP